MSAAIALTTLCSETKCRRRQNIPGDRIWHVDVRQGPGTIRMAGWRCMFCGTDNTTPIKHLHKNIAQILPSKSQAMARLAEKAPVASQRAITTAAPTPVVVRMPPRQTARVADAAPAPTAVRAAALPTIGRRVAGQPAPAPVAAAQAPAALSATQGQADALPQWLKGDRAREVLAEALARIAAYGGDALALSSSTGRFEPVEISMPTQPFANEAANRVFAGEILDELDDLQADMLMLGGKVNGRPWQAILHFSAGVATFV